MPDAETSRFDCLVCGKSEPLRRGCAVVCAIADDPIPNGLWREGIRHHAGGVCGDCLRNRTIEEMIAVPGYAKLLTSQTRAVILLETAEAKGKVDNDFRLDDFLDDYGLREIYEDSHDGDGE